MFFVRRLKNNSEACYLFSGNEAKNPVPKSLLFVFFCCLALETEYPSKGYRGLGGTMLALFGAKLLLSR
ncbi:hypothetical protein BIY27_03650 [Gibbsiella quercinecans]|nr:hypothetical protein BIY27_03650 [Gibbsiella quercinecans]